MRNIVAIICKVTSIIYFIFVFMTLIISNFDSELIYNSGSPLTVLASTFIFCLIIFGIGEIIEILDDINTYTNKLSDTKMRERWEKDKGKMQINTSSDGNWTCTECGVENKTQSIQCKDCGNYR